MLVTDISVGSLTGPYIAQITLGDAHTHWLRHTHAQADRDYLNSSGAKCQMSSGPLGPILLKSKQF